MPQEKGWFLHGGDIHELMARVERRVDQLTREAAEMGGPPAKEPPAEGRPPGKPGPGEG